MRQKKKERKKLPPLRPFSTMHDDLKDSRTKRNINTKNDHRPRPRVEMAGLIRFSLRIDSLFVY